MPPRLLYLSDVPVESSYHGSTLVYRLLQKYPPERLRIVEGNLFPARTDRRLPGVVHETLHVGRPRLLNSRFHDWYSRWVFRGAARRAGQIDALTRGFSPEAVLTVGHGYTWLTAARYARAHNLPLHLLVHDDWPSVGAPQMRATVDRAFGDVYRQAASRLCTSPFMAEEYERRYGARGTVLLPYRAIDAPVFPDVAERLHRDNDAPVFVFAGTINTPGYASLLRRLADAIEPHRGQLLIFGPIEQAQLGAAGLDRSNVRLGGLLKADELLLRLRADADVLYVPMSFAPDDRENMRMGFPTKLTDYTAVGLPLLIVGPPDCSAVTWGQSRRGVAEVVTTDEPSALAAAVSRLATNAAHRSALAAAAQRAGNEDFSPATAHRILMNALRAAA